MWLIYDNIYLGCKKDSGDVHMMNELGITHIINATMDLKNHFENLKSVECKYLIKQPSKNVGSEESTTGTPAKYSIETDESVLDQETDIVFDEEESDDEEEGDDAEEDDEDDDDEEDDDVTMGESVEIAMIESYEEMVSPKIEKPVVDTETTDNVVHDVTITTTTTTNAASAIVSCTSELSVASEPKTPTTPMTPSRRRPEYRTEIVELVNEIKYLRVPAADSMEENLSRFFEDAVAFISNAFNESDNKAKVLVHCREGRSRSVTLLLVYGMKVLNLSLKDAYENMMKKSRGRPRINDGFKRQLMKFELDLLNERQTAMVVDTVDQVKSDDQVAPAAVENSLDFFSARRDRKRARSYREYDADDDFNDGDYVEPARKRRKKNKKGKRKALAPVTATILSYFAPLSAGAQPKKQATLFQMFKKDTPKTIEVEPVVEQKPPMQEELRKSDSESKPPTPDTSSDSSQQPQPQQPVEQASSIESVVEVVASTEKPVQTVKKPKSSNKENATPKVNKKQKKKQSESVTKKKTESGGKKSATSKKPTQAATGKKLDFSKPPAHLLAKENQTSTKESAAVTEIKASIKKKQATLGNFFTKKEKEL